MKNARVKSQPKKVKDKELEEFLNENPYRTQSELAEALGVTRQAICECRLHKQDSEGGFCMCLVSKTRLDAAIPPRPCYPGLKRKTFCTR